MDSINEFLAIAVDTRDDSVGDFMGGDTDARVLFNHVDGSGNKFRAIAIERDGYGGGRNGGYGGGVEFIFGYGGEIDVSVNKNEVDGSKNEFLALNVWDFSGGDGYGGGFGSDGPDGSPGGGGDGYGGKGGKVIIGYGGDNNTCLSGDTGPESTNCKNGGHPGYGGDIDVSVDRNDVEGSKNRLAARNIFDLSGGDGLGYSGGVGSDGGPEGGPGGGGRVGYGGDGGKYTIGEEGYGGAYGGDIEVSVDRNDIDGSKNILGATNIIDLSGGNGVGSGGRRGGGGVGYGGYGGRYTIGEEGYGGAYGGDIEVSVDRNDIDGSKNRLGATNIVDLSGGNGLGSSGRRGGRQRVEGGPEGGGDGAVGYGGKGGKIEIGEEDYGGAYGGDIEVSVDWNEIDGSKNILGASNLLDLSGGNGVGSSGRRDGRPGVDGGPEGGPGGGGGGVGYGGEIQIGEEGYGGAYGGDIEVSVDRNDIDGSKNILGATNIIDLSGGNGVGSGGRRGGGGVGYGGYGGRYTIGEEGYGGAYGGDIEVSVDWNEIDGSKNALTATNIVDLSGGDGVGSGGRDRRDRGGDGDGFGGDGGNIKINEEGYGGYGGDIRVGVDGNKIEGSKNILSASNVVDLSGGDATFGGYGGKGGTRGIGYGGLNGQDSPETTILNDFPQIGYGGDISVTVNNNEIDGSGNILAARNVSDNSGGNSGIVPQQGRMIDSTRGSGTRRVREGYGGGYGGYGAPGIRCQGEGFDASECNPQPGPVGGPMAGGDAGSSGGAAGGYGGRGGYGGGYGGVNNDGTWNGGGLLVVDGGDGGDGGYGGFGGSVVDTDGGRGVRVRGSYGGFKAATGVGGDGGSVSAFGQGGTGANGGNGGDAGFVDLATNGEKDGGTWTSAGGDGGDGGYGGRGFAKATADGGDGVRLVGFGGSVSAEGTGGDGGTDTAIAAILLSVRPVPGQRVSRPLPSTVPAVTAVTVVTAVTPLPAPMPMAV